MSPSHTAGRKAEVWPHSSFKQIYHANKGWWIVMLYCVTHPLLFSQGVSWSQRQMTPPWLSSDLWSAKTKGTKQCRCFLSQEIDSRKTNVWSRHESPSSLHQKHQSATRKRRPLFKTVHSLLLHVGKACCCYCVCFNVCVIWRPGTTSGVILGWSSISIGTGSLRLG